MSTAAPKRPISDSPRRQTIPSETFSQVYSLAQRLHAMFRNGQPVGTVVGVTSCTRQEGVSVVAANLAACAADIYSGRVLLVDANLRNPSLASRFGVKQSPGLSDCLSGQSAAQECVVRTSHPNLWMIPSGSTTHAAGRASDSRSNALLDELRSDFELILLDLPSAGEMDETAIASQSVDGFLLVLEAERVRKHVAQRIKHRLEQGNAKLLGVVLNKRKNYIPEWLYRRL
ncbi:MAG: CpsD/CapB family tyrosine-protein kinase [Planctomycetaceae bacterium]|nr:CpsD/CapB family tyrosine-protein kinase [Planctomycetales bacterium]MCB9923776.1 CpsD/CapB family tyrosine-protein kinase [Planctomycetaceae bacterium]